MVGRKRFVNINLSTRIACRGTRLFDGLYLLYYLNIVFSAKRISDFGISISIKYYKIPQEICDVNLT